MAERPILFSGPLVKAIIAGRKTETRRLVTKGTSVAPKTVWSHKGDEVISVPGWANLDFDAPATKVKGCRGRYCTSWVDGDAATRGQYLHVPAMDHETRHRVRARIEPEDTLYVRESWRTTPGLDEAKPSKIPCAWIRYDADGSARSCGTGDARNYTLGLTPKEWGKGRPSIFMPKWASRIRLRVTEVCAERLQAIDQAGARAEGIVADYGAGETDRHLFAKLWDKINAGREGAAWPDDPWVWVYKFEVIS